jgi:hypothetical protein
VPTRSTLPNAFEMYATHLACRRDRPPWGCVATPELALDYLGISPQVLWSYRLRRQGPPVEEDAKRLLRGVGKRTIYRYEVVLDWLPGGEEATRGRPWHWTRSWASSIGAGQVPDDPEAVLALVERLERDPIVKARPYGFRNPAKGLERLRAAYGC